MSLKLFLLLAVVTVALLAAGNSPNHHYPIFRSGESSGERVQISMGTSFQTLSSNCGYENSGNNAVGPKYYNSHYSAGSSSPFVNLQASQVEVISNGYRVTYYVESIPEYVQVTVDDFFLYNVNVYNSQNCIKEKSAFLNLYALNFRDEGEPAVNMTFENMLTEYNYATHVDANGDYSFISYVSSVAVDRTANTITMDYNTPGVSLPTASEAATYSVDSFSYYSGPNDVSEFGDVCNIVGTNTPKACCYPYDSAVCLEPSSSSASKSASSSASGGGGIS